MGEKIVEIMGMEFHAPHCDGDVLHYPGSCKYCDEFPQRQQDRLKFGVGFTNELNGGYMGRAPGQPCPATVKRAVASINNWPGNRPTSDEGVL